MSVMSRDIDLLYEQFAAVVEDRDQEWRLQAACRGKPTAMFFPARGDNIAEALAVCADCPVILDCLRTGLRERSGIWGGLPHKARRAVSRRVSAGVPLVDAAEPVWRTWGVTPLATTPAALRADTG